MKSKVYSSVEQFKEQNAELKTDLPISDDNSVLCQKVKIGNLELSTDLYVRPWKVVTERRRTSRRADGQKIRAAFKGRRGAYLV